MWNLLAIIAGWATYSIVESLTAILAGFLIDLPIISNILSFPTTPVLYLYSLTFVVPIFLSFVVVGAICQKSKRPNVGFLANTFFVTIHCISAIVNNWIEYGGFSFDLIMPPVFGLGLTILLAHGALEENNEERE